MVLMHIPGMALVYVSGMVMLNGMVMARTAFAVDGRVVAAPNVATLVAMVLAAQVIWFRLAIDWRTGWRECRRRWRRRRWQWWQTWKHLAKVARFTTACAYEYGGSAYFRHGGDACLGHGHAERDGDGAYSVRSWRPYCCRTTRDNSRGDGFGRPSDLVPARNRLADWVAGVQAAAEVQGEADVQVKAVESR